MMISVLMAVITLNHESYCSMLPFEFINPSGRFAIRCMQRFSFPPSGLPYVVHMAHDDV
jgi:hypothetical protein